MITAVSATTDIGLLSLLPLKMPHPHASFPSPALLQRNPPCLPFPYPFPRLPLVPISCISISFHSTSSLSAPSRGVPPSWSPQVPARALAVGGRLPPVGASYHQPVGGISPPSQTPTAASKIQLSAELAESHFHHKNAHVLPESRAVIGTAWPERSRQLSP